MAVESPRWLLDSVILIDHFNGIPAATEFIAANFSSCSISVVTRAEVLTGFNDEQAKLATQLIDKLPLLGVTVNDADMAAKLRRDNRWKLPDAFQAALAINNGLKLVSRNTKDFSPSKHPFVTVPYSLNPID